MDVSSKGDDDLVPTIDPELLHKYSKETEETAQDITENKSADEDAVKTNFDDFNGNKSERYLKTETKENMQSCSYCDTSLPKYRLLEHVVGHLTKQLHDSFDEDFQDGSPCPMCIAQNKNNPFIMKAKANYIRHIGSTHRIILDFIPKEEPHLKMLEFLKEPTNPRRKQRKSQDPMSGNQPETSEESTVKKRAAPRKSGAVTPSKAMTNNESNLDVKKAKGSKRRSKNDQLLLQSPPGPKTESVFSNENEEKLVAKEQINGDGLMTSIPTIEESVPINVTTQVQGMTENEGVQQDNGVEMKEKKKRAKRRSKAEIQAAAENDSLSQTDPENASDSLPLKKKPGRKPTKIPVKAPVLPKELILPLTCPSEGLKASQNPIDAATTSTQTSKTSTESTASQSTEDLLLSKLTSSITVERKAGKSSKIQIPVKTQKLLQCGECSVSVDTKQELLKHMKLHM